MELLFVSRDGLRSLNFDDDALLAPIARSRTEHEADLPDETADTLAAQAAVWQRLTWCELGMRVS